MKSQLEAFAKDKARNGDKGVIIGEAGVAELVTCVYKSDPLSVVSEVDIDFIAFSNNRHAVKEKFNSFETKFDVLVSNFKSNHYELPSIETLIALQLLNAANIGENQSVSIPAA